MRDGIVPSPHRRCQHAEPVTLRPDTSVIDANENQPVGTREKKIVKQGGAALITERCGYRAHRRFVGCNKQVRAKAFKPQGDEYRNLEYFLTYMSNGIPWNGPGARK
jgi:hypothetical protein